MKKIVLLVIVAALIAFAFYKMNQGEELVVSTVQVQRGDVVSSVSNTRAGTVDACRRAGIAPNSGGTITALYVSDGDRVSKDQLLLELWNADLKAQVEVTKRDATAAKSLSRQSCVTADVAKRAAERLVTLRKTNVASKDAVEKAVGEAESAAAACQASKDVARVRLAAVEASVASLERTQLRAPFDGVIGEINGELGEFVTPSPVGVATPPTVDLIDNSCLYILAPIDEVDAPQVQAGMKAWITLDAFKDRKFSGRVQRVAPYVLDREKQSRTVDVEAVIDDPEMQVLLPGYSADVEVVVGEKQDVVFVATSAVLEDSSVYVIPQGGGVIEKRSIETGIGNWQQTEVISGLRSGEYVVRTVDRDGVEDGAEASVEKD
ncbi:MAG: efflux RND transporter periplasmic adaptor subunit [Pseudomonadales bacterium]